MSMSDVPVGGVTVEVKASLDPLVAGLAKGRAESQAFERAASANMAGVSNAARAMAATVDASARKTAEAFGQSAAGAAKVGEAAKASGAVQSDAAKRTADAVIAQAKRQADEQIAQQRRVAEHQAAIARGDLIKDVNPVTGAVSYRPTLATANRRLVGAGNGTPEQQAEFAARTAAFKAGASTVASEAEVAGGGLATLSRGFITVTGVALAAGAALTIAKTALQAAREATQWSADLVKTADALGVTTDQLQRYDAAAVQSGVSIATLRSGLGRLNGILGDLQAGTASKELRDLFKGLGFTPEQLRGMNDASQLLPLLADKIRNLGTQAERVKVAEMLGLRDTLPLLEKGSAGIKAFGDEAARTGGIIEERLLRQQAALNVHINANDEAIRTKLMRAFIELAPILEASSDLAVKMAGALEQIAGAAGNAASAIEDWSRRHRNAVASAADAAISNLPIPGASLLGPMVNRALRQPNLSGSEFESPDRSFSTASPSGTAQQLVFPKLPKTPKGRTPTAGQRAEDLAFQLNDQAKAQEAVNVAVAKGEITAGQAIERLQQERQLLPALTALTRAHGKERERLVAAIDAVRSAQTRLNAAQMAGELQTKASDNRDVIERLQLEAKLVGATADERERELAALAERQRLVRQYGPGADKTPAGQASVQSETDKADAQSRADRAKFVSDLTRASDAQVKALQSETAQYGMAWQAAATYGKEQELLAQATAAKIKVDDQLAKTIHEQATRYGEAAEAARKYEEAQKDLADAANFTAHAFGDNLVDAITGAQKPLDALRSLVDDLLKASTASLLYGEGPLAGVLGTARTDGPGQPNHGWLSQMFGKAFNVGQPATNAIPGTHPVGTDPIGDILAGPASALGLGRSAPTGASPADPIWVRMAMGGGTESNDVLANLLGKPSNDNIPAGLVREGTDPIGDLLAAGDNAAQQIDQVFTKNSSGGFVGALENALANASAGSGGGTGKAGKILDLVSKGLKLASAGTGPDGFGGSGDAVNGMTMEVPLHHTGGEIGAHTATRKIFFPSQRTGLEGLGPDEFLTVLERGEKVSPKHAARGRGGDTYHVSVGGPMTGRAARETADQLAGRAATKSAIARRRGYG